MYELYINFIDILKKTLYSWYARWEIRRNGEVLLLQKGWEFSNRSNSHGREADVLPETTGGAIQDRFKTRSKTLAQPVYIIWAQSVQSQCYGLSLRQIFKL